MKTLTMFLLLALSGCSRFHQLSGAEMLAKCWDARVTGGTGEYDVTLAGMSANGIEGGNFSRTLKCPDIIMNIVVENPAVAGAFDAAGRRSGTSVFFGFYLKGKVKIRREAKFGVDVTLERVDSMRPMSGNDFQKYLKGFRLA